MKNYTVAVFLFFSTSLFAQDSVWGEWELDITKSYSEKKLEMWNLTILENGSIKDLESVVSSIGSSDKYMLSIDDKFENQQLSNRYSIRNFELFWFF